MLGVADEALAYPLSGLARASLGAGEPEQALAYAERVFALAGVDPEATSMAEFAAAGALIKLRRDRPRAAKLLASVEAALAGKADADARKMLKEAAELRAKLPR